ncbi:SGNH/GDSL hydrolase family protein [Zoogloea sp.]|jgi:lysophospholipase L1-like esterase|uniref:SGNH/GDSL hydrolase family protein n=1 Tax=Zoogloea sp. TaxID=49181 RepID=UPI0037D993D3
MPVSRYVTLRTVKHSGSEFPVGTPMALSDDYSAPLLAIGAIQAQAGALPTMPTVPGDVVRETVDTGSGGKARTYVEAISLDGGLDFPMAGGLVQSGRIRDFPYPMAAIGNSLVAGTNTNNALSFAQQLGTRCPEIFSSVANLGVGGQSSAAALAALTANGVPKGVRYVVYHEGTNDSGATPPVTVAQHIANIRSIWEWCAARGIALIVVAAATVDIQGTWTATSRALTEQYAFAERMFCADNKVIFVDPWLAWIDTDGTWNAAASVADGIHPPQAVHDAVAAEIVAQLRARRPAPLLPRSNAGSAGIYPSFGNVLNLTGAGLPAGWSQNGIAPTSIAPSAASAPVRGNWADAMLTNLAGSGDFYRYLHAGGQFAAGDRVKISGYFKFTNSSNCRLAARLSLVRSVAPNFSLYLFDTSSSFGETYYEGEIVVPPDLTQATLWISYKPASGSGTFSGSFSFACFDCYNISNVLL